ncbi:MAG: glycosyltransferase [Acidobacteriota bacterium]
MKLSWIVVAFHSSPVIGPAIESFRKEARAAGHVAEVVVIDHSDDAAETAALEALEPEHLEVRPNAGYAAGLNAGRSHATGEILLFGNPDLHFEAGSVAALVKATGEADLVGPQFELAGFLFPPAEPRTVREERRRQRAGRSPGAWFRTMRRETDRCRRVWEASSLIAVRQLSGALVACRREVAERLGPWDESYFLYFEETDWIDRAHRLGLTVALEPRARVVHSWGHAARPSGQAERYARSRRRYFRSRGWLGRLALRTPKWGEDLPFAAGELPGERRRDLGPAWWLASPTSLGMPAAGLRSHGVPLESLRALHEACPEALSLVVSAVPDEGSAVAGVWRSDPPSGAQ